MASRDDQSVPVPSFDDDGDVALRVIDESGAADDPPGAPPAERVLAVPGQGLPGVPHLAPDVHSIAIVGFTSTRSDAPFGRPGTEVWGMNNLHRAPDMAGKRFDRWFDLHPLDMIVSDADHVAWLESASIPVYVWEPQEAWPTSVAFPKDEVLRAFGHRYYTNSVSWMVALAVMALHPRLEAAQLGDGPLVEIGIYGVDMAQDSEYAAQRPSCEYVIGIAAGMGYHVTIPTASDLLQSAALYGVEDNRPLRRRMDARVEELKARIADLEARRSALVAEQGSIEAQIHANRGALEDVNYWRGVWTQPVTHEPGKVDR